MTEDAALVDLARSGDASAFAELYERYFDRIYDFLARMVRDPAEAADLTQDTFIKAMSSLHTLNKGASFKSWLFTIARNSALNRLERAARVRPLERTTDDGDEHQYDVVDPHRFGNPEEAAEAASLAAIVWEAAEGLDPRSYSVLHLTVREGLESAEIADVLGVTRNNAYVMVNRMKKALEDAIGALVLFRAGRPHCAELDSALASIEIPAMSPEVRRLIDRHAASCENCHERRRKLASPFAVFAGFAPVEASAGIKEAILDNVADAFNGLFGGNLAQTSEQSLEPTQLGSESTLPIAAHSYSSGYDSQDDLIAATPVVAGGTQRRYERRTMLAVAGAAFLFLIGGPVAALALLGGSGEPAPSTVALEPTATGQAAVSTGTIPATSADMTTATATPILVETPTATSTPVPIQPGASGPSLGTPGEASETSTPVAAAPEPSQPPLEAPPTATPDGSGPTPGSGGSLLPPPTPTPTPQPCTSSLTAIPTALVFEETGKTLTVRVSGDGCGGALDFTAQTGVDWLIVTPTSGSIPSGGSQALTVTVDPSVPGTGSGRIRIASSAGTQSIIVTVDLPGPTPTPTPSPSPSPNPTPPCSTLICPTLPPSLAPR